MDDYPQYAHKPDLDYMMPIKAPTDAIRNYREELEAHYACGGLWVCVWHPYLTGRLARWWHIEKCSKNSTPATTSGSHLSKGLRRMFSSVQEMVPTCIMLTGCRCMRIEFRCIDRLRSVDSEGRTAMALGSEFEAIESSPSFQHYRVRMRLT